MSAPRRNGAGRGAGDGPWPARIEWFAASVAAATVLWMVGLLAREAIGGARTPPDLAILLEPPVVEDGRAGIDFTLRNRGGRAASSVAVALRLGDAGAPIARRLVIDHAPAQSETTGRFYLDADELRLGPVGLVEGYVDP